LADEWGMSIKDYRITLSASELMDHTAPLVRNGIHRALELAHRGGRQLLLNDVVDDITRSALLLLPLEMRAPWIGWPLFAVMAFKPVFEYFADKIRNRAATLQRTISEQLAYLGNRVSGEFVNEMKLRIADLQQWQGQAIETAAAHQAQVLVPSFI